MLIEKIDLYKEYNLKREDNYSGYLTIYAETDSRKEMKMKDEFPCMLVIPGGGYEIVSAREAEPIAINYLANGFISAVLDYTTHEKYPRPLIEAMLALKYLKENSEKYYIRKDKIACIGLSAGGHLAGLLSTLNDEERNLVNGSSYRPDLTILSYPVITSDESFAHYGTIYIANLLNNPIGAIEKRVDKDTPPMFIWTTREDNAVPYMNSVVMSDALKKNNIEHEFVLFEKGVHGLSTADYRTVYMKDINDDIDEVSKWFKMSIDFLRDNGFYSKAKWYNK